MKNSLAIIDYGVGGLDLVRKIKVDHPDIAITYFSDSGEIPYGKLSKKKLKDRIALIIDFLKKTGCDHIIVACHSASSVVNSNDSMVTTMIPYTLSCLDYENVKSIGIIGGGRTINSRLYSDHYRALGFEVFQRVAQELSILVERGEIRSDYVTDAVHKILKPIRGIDTLLLACTHYPVLYEVIAKYMNTSCKIVDPMDHMYAELKKQFEHFSKGKDIYYTTGSGDTMSKVACNVYGLDLGKMVELNYSLERI